MRRRDNAQLRSQLKKVSASSKEGKGSLDDLLDDDDEEITDREEVIRRTWQWRALQVIATRFRCIKILLSSSSLYNHHYFISLVPIKREDDCLPYDSGFRRQHCHYLYFSSSAYSRATETCFVFWVSWQEFDQICKNLLFRMSPNSLSLPLMQIRRVVTVFFLGELLLRLFTFVYVYSSLIRFFLDCFNTIDFTVIVSPFPLPRPLAGFSRKWPQ